MLYSYSVMMVRHSFRRYSCAVSSQTKDRFFLLEMSGILSRDDCPIGSLAENPSSNQVLLTTLADVLQGNEECSLVPE